METWLAMLLIVTAVALLVAYARRKDRRRERAEVEVPEDIFDASAGRGGAPTGPVGGRGSRSSDQDRSEGDAGDGGGGE